MTGVRWNQKPVLVCVSLLVKMSESRFNVLGDSGGFPHRPDPSGFPTSGVEWVPGLSRLSRHLLSDSQRKPDGCEKAIMTEVDFSTEHTATVGLNPGGHLDTWSKPLCEHGENLAW